MSRTKSLLLTGTMLSAFMTGWFVVDGLAAANLVVAQAGKDDDDKKGKAPPGRPGGAPPAQQRPAAPPQQQAPQRPPQQQAPAQIQRPPQQPVQQQAPPQLQQQRREPPPQMQRAAPPRDESPPAQKQIQQKGPEPKGLQPKGPGAAGRPGGLPPQGEGQRPELRREGQREEAPQRPGGRPGERPGQPPGAAGQQRPGQPGIQPQQPVQQQPAQQQPSQPVQQPQRPAQQAPSQQPGQQQAPAQQLVPGQQPQQPAQQQVPGRQQQAPVIVPGQQVPVQQRPDQPPQQPAQQQQPGQPVGAQQAAPERAQNLTEDVKSRRLDDVKRERRESREGDRLVIREPGRTIVREDNRTIIRHDETERFRRFSGGNVRSERRGSEVVTVTQRSGGVTIVTVVDADGRLVRRARRLNDGREIIIIDNSFGGRPPPQRGYFVDIAPPVIRIPRERYIVEAEQANEEMIYQALTAPPVDYVERAYTLDEVRYSPNLRARMPAVDIDTINFESGSWDVTPDQIARLSVVANAIRRAIGGNPNEVFLIEGHTDAVGPDVDNLSLSDRRAESVASILTQDFQIPPENLTTQGYGEQYLKVQVEGPSRENRRVTARRITPLLSGETSQPPRQ